MNLSQWASDKTRHGMVNRLLIASLIISLPAFFLTERYLRTLSPFLVATFPFAVSAVSFSADRSAIAVYSQTHSMHATDKVAVYEFPALRERWHINVAQPYGIRFSSDGKRVTMDNYKTYSEWDSQTGTMILSDASRMKDKVWSVEAGSVGRRYEVYKKKNKKKQSWFIQDRRDGTSRFLQDVSSAGWSAAVFTPDEKYLIAVNRVTGQIRYWRTANAELIPVPKLWSELKPADLYPTPDGRLIALCRDDTVRELSFSPSPRSEESDAAKVLSRVPIHGFTFGRLVDEGRFVYISSANIYRDNVRVMGNEADKLWTKSRPDIRYERVEQILDRRTGKVRTFTGWNKDTHYDLIGNYGWALAYDTPASPTGIIPNGAPRLQDLRSDKEWGVPHDLAQGQIYCSRDGVVAASAKGGRQVQFWKLPVRENDE